MATQNVEHQSFLDTSLYIIQGSNSPKKRIRYKIPSYIKKYKNDVVEGQILNDDVSLWGEMKKVYIELANYFPLPFGSTKTVFDFGYVRVWKQEYTNKSYMYKDKRFKEVPDLFIEAEIKGTENLPIDKRLKIHKQFLNYLKNGYTIEKALENVKGEK